MSSENFVRIATHDGMFHGDEVLSVAVLSTVFPHHQIVRTRDPDILEFMDIVVDVGDRYDHAARRYDHHMHDPPVDRFGHLLSSAGLVWSHYGRLYLKAIGIPGEFHWGKQTVDLIGAVDKYIKIHWINPIDRVDNGVASGPTPVSEIVRAMKPIDPEKNRKRCDLLFMETVSMVSHLFKRSCFHGCDHVMGKIKWQGCQKDYLADGRIVVCHEHVPNYKVFNDSDLHFVVSPTKEYQDDGIYWTVRPLLKKESDGEGEGNREYHTPFPSDLLGRRQDYIESHSPFKGIQYIHHAGHMALVDNHDHAVQFCLLLLGS